MHSIKFKNWAEFKANIVKDLSKGTTGLTIKDFIFRGQADSNWRLLSSFDRIEKDKSKFDILMENFKQICGTYNYKEDLFSTTDSNAVAAYAQHYGLPTRLLDWTTSPYFAAFFAFSTAFSLRIKTKTCTIWAINKKSESLNKQKGLKFISFPSNKFNYRMKNQLGHFTLSEHTEDSIDDFDIALLNSTKIDDFLWK